MSELPQGYRDIPEEDRRKAQRFFERGKTVADTGNYEYAIEMYLQGLTIDPEEVEAHKALREISLKRKVSGGKALGMFEGRKYPTSTKDDKQNMLNAERLLAYDPGNMNHMVTLMQSAYRAGFYDSVLWVGNVLLKTNADAQKKDYNKFIILKDHFKAIHEWKLATDACHYALSLQPENMDLQKELKDLGAQHTMSAGRYGRAKSFRESVRDMAKQQDLLEGEKDTRSIEYLARKAEEAAADYDANPDDPAKFSKMIDAMRATEQLDFENRAIELLDRKYQETRQFRWRQRAGEIKMSQLSRMERTLRGQLQGNPNDPELRSEYNQFLQDKVRSELEEYRLITEAYPTDSAAKFEMAQRMFMLRQFQDAIPVFQHVRSDPKYRVRAATLLGRAFLEAGYLEEAVDTLKVVIDEYPAKGDERSRDMTYWYGRALEQHNDPAAALKQYSQVAQWDFNFRDVQERIKRLRTAPKV